MSLIWEDFGDFYPALEGYEVPWQILSFNFNAVDLGIFWRLLHLPLGISKNPILADI